MDLTDLVVSLVQVDLGWKSLWLLGSDTVAVDMVLTKRHTSANVDILLEPLLS